MVVQTDDRYQEQHSDMNAMLFQRIGQILKGFQQDPERKRKIYIMFDEFVALGYIPDLVSMFLRLRSRGVVFLITYQSWASMKRIYKDEAYEILNTCRNFIILGSGDPIDAKHAAEVIGKYRGFEAQHNRSEADGTNESEAVGTSDATGTSFSQTRLKGAFKNPPMFSDPKFIPTDTKGTSATHTKSYTGTRGTSKTSTAGVTWIYVDRDIASQTEIMRTPLPTPENGVHGIAYRAGEPRPWDFVYEVDYIRAQVHRTHQFVDEYLRAPRPSRTNRRVELQRT